MPYIHFTAEQKLRASEVDLELFLRSQGEKLIRSGPEFRLASDHSITVQGNEWYDHAAEKGGGPISFVRNFYNLSYPEAVTLLLGGEQGTVYEPAQKQKEKPQKEFALPPANREMRRVYAYLLKRRFLDREVVNAFVKAGLLYESCEKFKGREYHNAVFVGKDENGAARHAHKRSVNSEGKTFRINVEGCEPRFSFHYTGTSDRLYVFEAPIDLLSFVTRYPKGWQEHSYVALCGTSGHAMLWMLEQNPNLRSVVLCLDHDPAGIEASGRLAESLHERGYDSVGVLQPEYKDWNEDLKARLGLPAQEAEEHPQLVAAGPICHRIALLMENARPDRLGKELIDALKGYRTNFQAKRMDAAMACMEQAAAFALFAYSREMRQMGQLLDDTELEDRLRSRILPHQNRGSIQNRHSEVAAQTQNVLARYTAPGIRTAEDKEQLASAWLDLAVSLAKIPVKYDADMLKEEQKLERSNELKMEAM
ncbi:DUF3991 domain-containing protein [Pseudoflavonifractor sp. 60]|uniref:DUF3991 and toprim domain-containing protein n=1 Tax=Pseudoflavonifractor sp. 60 TaxID=2304576 RepID=UPI001370256B|nr:DUF3991 and toprim domain-containing protein [Pseudoflavonifractor sp. 60]NBI65994.1 DUF3991 domain-containing protein [Pseudoflavonifractor sp. 60]